MTSRIIVVPRFDYVVFGGTGDLARRKLLPALYQRGLDRQLPSEARIIGISRRSLTSDEYRTEVKNALQAVLHRDKSNPKRSNGSFRGSSM
jgi:glucose-6-phosphate 1-dehydrogenase